VEITVGYKAYQFLMDGMPILYLHEFKKFDIMT
jgi:hypothetical protein